MLLVWDGLEIKTTYSNAHEDRSIPGIERLIEEGLVGVEEKPFDPRFPPEERKPFDEEWSELPWEMIARIADEERVRRISENAAEDVVQLLVAHIDDARLVAARLGLAPVAATTFAAFAACLPVSESGPVIEGTLIQAASKGVRVEPGSGIDDVLVFRERHRALMGRFRAAMIDLAAAIDTESAGNGLEQAHAMIRNRVEPALGDLETALKGSRIRFAWKTLIGASALALSPATGPAAAVAGGGHVLSQPIRYAFNRDRLVREHPYGLLYQAKTDFDFQPSLGSRPITDPKSAMKFLLADLITAAQQATIDAVRRRQGE